MSPTTTLGIEPAYIIRRKSDGYPISVNKSQMEIALATGDYEYSEPYEHRGFTYSNGSGTVEVPNGYRVAEGQKTIDPRLG